MKAYWKKAYSCWYSYSKQVDAATNAVADYGKRSIDTPLQNSAVARLLVEGRLPADAVAGNDPVDLSAKARLVTPPLTPLPVSSVTPIKTEAIDQGVDSIETIQSGMRKEMDMLKNIKGPEGFTNTWKCRYCPYNAPSSTTLFSHYQFHQQLLTSQSSKPHQEWLAAYRRAKDEGRRRASPSCTSNGENTIWNSSTPSSYSPVPYPGPGCPPGTVPGAPYSLKSLLTKNEDNQQSASGFLRSIVQAVMQKTPPSGQAPTSSSIYASLLSQSEKQFSTVSEPPQTQLQLTTPLQSPGMEKKSERKRPARGKRKNASPRGSPSPKMAAIETTLLDAVGERSYSPVLDVVNCDTDVPALSQSGEGSGYNIQELPLNFIGSGDLQENVTQHVTTDISASPARPPSEIGPAQNDLSFSRCVLTPQGSSPAYSSVQIPARWHSASVSDSVSLNNNHISSSDSSDDESETESRRGYPSGRLDGELTWISASDPNLHRRRPSIDSNESVISSVSKRVCSPLDITGLTSDYHSGTFTDSPRSVTERNTAPRSDGITEERGVQCDLLLPPCVTSDPRGDVQEGLASSESTNGIIKCLHCGISFDDDVMFSIHMGMHSHTDPFVCNVCGRSCGNRYGFYTHIMRGHQNG